MPLTEWDETARNITVKQLKCPVITLFTMPTCAPCKQMERELELLEKEYKNKAVFGKCQADEYQGTVHISSVPRIFITVFGEVLCECGIVSLEKLRMEINEAIEEMEDRLNDEET